jgi:hypothetical protein
MDTRQIICCLRDVGLFLAVFPSDLLTRTVRSGTIIVKTDRHTESVSHWLVIQIQSSSSKIYYFDSYGLPPLIHSIQSFINRNCTVWDYNLVQLQGPTTAVCAKYCCLFALYADRGYTPQKSIEVVGTVDTDKSVFRIVRGGVRFPIQNGVQRWAM